MVCHWVVTITASLIPDRSRDEEMEVGSLWEVSYIAMAVSIGVSIMDLVFGSVETAVNDLLPISRTRPPRSDVRSLTLFCTRTKDVGVLVTLNP